MPVPARSASCGGGTSRCTTTSGSTAPPSTSRSTTAISGRHRQRKHLARKTPLNQGNRPGLRLKADGQRRPGEHYTVCTYRRAIAHGCDAAFPLPDQLARRNRETNREWKTRLTVEQRAAVASWRRAHRWHPHQLRHNAATTLRREFGIDAAQTILGHRLGSAITELYAEANVSRAMEAIRLIG